MSRLISGVFPRSREACLEPAGRPSRRGVRRGAILQLALISVVIFGIRLPALAKEDWFALDTRNFSVISNGREADVRELALRLEQFRQAYSQLWGSNSVVSPPLHVVAFASDNGFRPFKPLYHGRPKPVDAFFATDAHQCYVALDLARPRSELLEIIFHEYTHFLTRRYYDDWPLWLSEGVAEVYSNLSVEKNTVVIGDPKPNRAYFLRSEKMLPLSDLFRVDPRSPYYNELDRGGTFYAESWALTHYLMFGADEARRKQFFDFVRALQGDKPTEQAFAQAFGSAPGTIEKDFRAYIERGRYPMFKLTFDSGFAGEKKNAVRPLTPAEVQFHQGMLLLLLQRFEKAEPVFLKCRQTAPETSLPYEGLGLLALRRDKSDEARQNFEQAVARANPSYLAYFYYAEALVHAAHGQTNRIDRIPRATAGKMTSALRKSIQLMPTFAPSHHLLGIVDLVTEENLDEASLALQTAAKLEPGNRRYWYTLAQDYYRKKDLSAARQTLEWVLKGKLDSALREDAEDLLKRIDGKETEK